MATIRRGRLVLSAFRPCGTLAPMRRSRIGLVLLLPSRGLAWAPSALALTDEERAAARAAAGQGADAFAAGKWQEAVELFSRAEALVHAPAHLMFIARSELK